jgi:hypothetical protein
MVDLRKCAKKLQCPLWRILPVGIHHQDGIARDGLRGVDQTDSNGPLVSQVAPQAKYSD